MGFYTPLMNTKQVNLLAELGFSDIHFLSKGASDGVYSCVKHNIRYAVKLTRLDSGSWERESRALGHLSHPNILKPANIFQHERYGFIQMEYIPTTLKTFVTNNALDESKARTIFKQICEAVDACHKQGIAHMDLKPDNILINPDTLEVKLIDFGCCNTFEKNKKAAFFRFGTPGYRAPEILTKRPYYPDKADIWSLGAILYMLVKDNWFRPHGEEEEKSAYAWLHCGMGELLKGLSPELKALLRKMFRFRGHCRPSIQEILDHPWMTGKPFETSLWKSLLTSVNTTLYISK